MNLLYKLYNHISINEKCAKRKSRKGFSFLFLTLSVFNHFAQDRIVFFKLEFNP